MNQDDFLQLLGQCGTQMGAFLTDYLSDQKRGGEIDRPEMLMQAIRHGALNGGKRVRPFLMLETAKMLGANPDHAIHAAAGLECLHCYSLIHDDLPAMDDDDLRRGKPTVHKAFDEATAILAGDGLLTLAFDLTASDESGLDSQRRIKLVQALARDAGIGGMVGGQQLDLEYETKQADEAMITRIHAMKTGALIRYGCEAGAVIANVPDQERDMIRRYGEIIGLAFQLADDLLDVTADATTMGKATGKDVDAGKSTLIEIHGIQWAKKRLDSLVLEAEELLLPYGDKGDVLRAAAHFVAKRAF